jgi:hypothetical protein
MRRKRGNVLRYRQLRIYVLIFSPGPFFIGGRIRYRDALATDWIPKLHTPLAVFTHETLRCFVHQTFYRFSQAKPRLCELLLNGYFHGFSLPFLGVS